MSDKTGISWTDATWNPIRGCTRVSAGCENCYAEKVAHRFSGPGKPYEGLTVTGPKGPRWSGEIMLVPKVLDQPIRWQRPRRIFVNSMSDLFHENVPDEYIAQVFSVMQICHEMERGHVFQILTKRPERMRAWIEKYSDRHACDRAVDIGAMKYNGYHARIEFPLPNVWLGISAENQETADERIPILLETPAAVRFVSAEPLLGPIEFRQQRPDGKWPPDAKQPEGQPWLAHRDWVDDFEYWQTKGAGIHWVIAGGESGPRARACNVEWLRTIGKQCADAQIPYFVKQLGARPYLDVIEDESADDVSSWFGGASVDWNDSWESWFPKLDSRKGDDPREWPKDLRIQEFPVPPSSREVGS